MPCRDAAIRYDAVAALCWFDVCYGCRSAVSLSVCAVGSARRYAMRECSEDRDMRYAIAIFSLISAVCHAI